MKKAMEESMIVTQVFIWRRSDVTKVRHGGDTMSQLVGIDFTTADPSSMVTNEHTGRTLPYVPFLHFIIPFSFSTTRSGVMDAIQSGIIEDKPCIFAWRD